MSFNGILVVAFFQVQFALLWVKISSFSTVSEINGFCKISKEFGYPDKIS
jgi:hypothetical protein